MQANTNGKSDVQSSIRGDIYALAFFSIPCFILSWFGWQSSNTEAAKREAFLQTARSKVISVDGDAINAANEGQLVYVNGMMTTQPEILTDPSFNVSTKAFALVRQVKKGDENSVDALPYNPKLTSTYFSNPYPTMVWKTKEIKLGAYDLMWDQVFPLLELRTKNYDQDINRLESIRKAAIPIPLTPELRDQLSSQWGERFIEDEKGWSIQMKDQYRTQVQFRQFELLPTEVSILAQQRGNGFVPYSLTDDKIFEVKIGSHDIGSMFSTVQQRQIAKIYFSKGCFLLLFATGLVLVLQAFVPRKPLDENMVEAMSSGVESSSDYKQRILSEAEPFLLHRASSETFLAGKSRDIRSRFRLDDPSHVPIMLLSGLAVIYLVIMLLSKVVEFNFSALKKEDTQRDIVGFLLLIIAAVYWIMRKLETRSAQDRMIRDGRVLHGSILSCTGEVTGDDGGYWYFVKVVYRFSNPQKIEIIGQCERNRDDLNGHPLPMEGTAVLVLYLDDKTYALL